MIIPKLGYITLKEYNDIARNLLLMVFLYLIRIPLLYIAGNMLHYQNYITLLEFCYATQFC